MASTTGDEKLWYALPSGDVLRAERLELLQRRDRVVQLAVRRLGGGELLVRGVVLRVLVDQLLVLLHLRRGAAAASEQAAEVAVQEVADARRSRADAEEDE